MSGRSMSFSLRLALLFLAAATTSAVQLRGQADHLRADDEAKSLPEWAKEPITWVHTPKTGTSFLNSLIHHKGICPNTPDDLWFEKPNFASDHEFLEQYDRNDLCPGAFAQAYASPPGSLGVAEWWENNHNHAMAFFRQPEKRLTAGFYHKWHDWPHGLEKSNYGKNIRGYAEVMQGCQVRMLTWTDPVRPGNHKACGGNGTEPSKAEVQLAIERMKQMKFIGITEEWDLSVCLFHTLYGGECHDKEFMDTRPRATNEANYTYRHHYFTEDDRDLKGFEDPYDGPLYKAAKERFFNMLAENNVDRASCERTCKSATGTQPFALKRESGSSLLQLAADSDSDAYKYDWPGRRTYYVDEDYVDEE